MLAAKVLHEVKSLWLRIYYKLIGLLIPSTEITYPLGNANNLYDNQFSVEANAAEVSIFVGGHALGKIDGKLTYKHGLRLGELDDLIAHGQNAREHEWPRVSRLHHNLYHVQFVGQLRNQGLGSH